MADTLDLAAPLSQLMDTHPALRQDLASLDIAVDDPAETLPALARRLDVGLSVIAMALEAMGYDVVGYDPADEPGAGSSPLPDIMAAMFGVDRDGNPLPEPDLSQRSMCASELGHEPVPVFVHMEDAIRRAQEEGRLPKHP